MNNLKLVLIGLILLALGSGLGYYFSPDKIRIEEKIVEKEKIVYSKEKEVIEKYDPVTGNLVERIVKDKEKNSKETEDKTESVTEKEKTQKHYAVKAGAAVNVKDPSKIVPRAGVELRLPFFNSWIGAEADIEFANPKVGAYLRLEF